MHTVKTQSQADKETSSMLPYVVTWMSSIGIFALLIWVGVWLMQRP